MHKVIKKLYVSLLFVSHWLNVNLVATPDSSYYQMKDGENGHWDIITSWSLLTEQKEIGGGGWFMNEPCKCRGPSHPGRSRSWGPLSIHGGIGPLTQTEVNNIQISTY